MSQQKTCGCHIAHEKQGQRGVYRLLRGRERLIYCPLHAHAPAMREALEKIGERLHGAGSFGMGRDIDEIVSRVLRQIEEG